jgi:hypothetical protein
MSDEPAGTRRAPIAEVQSVEAPAVAQFIEVQFVEVQFFEVQFFEVQIVEARRSRGATAVPEPRRRSHRAGPCNRRAW